MKKPRTHAKKALMLLLGLLVAVRARRGGNRGYLTAYACEGTQLNISCETGRQIHLIRANYGRFSITICNEQGSLDWSVNCASLPSSYQAIKESCGMKQACVVPASSTIFGDPCPRTRKYLEAHYKCIAESTTVSTTTTSTTTSTTIANRPPIIIPVTHSFRPVIPLFHSSTTSSTENTPSFKSISTTASTGMGASPPSVSGSESSSKSPLDIYPDNDREGMYNPSRSVETTDPSLNSCPPTVSRNISWSWTRGGQDAIEPCPRGSIGRAKWFCVDAVSTVYWSGTSPDLSECQSPWAESLEGRIDGGESVVSIGTELAVIIRTKPLYGGDITQTLTILHRLVSRMEDRVQDIVDDKQKYRVILEMLHSVQSVASSLLEDFQHQAWRDMSILQQRFAASALIQRLEQNTWLLANTHSFGKRWSHAEKNILVSIRLVETWSITTVKFPQKEDVEETSWALIQDIIVLSAPALVGSGRNGFVKIIFVAYKNVQDFLTLGEIHPVSTNTDDSQNSMAVNTTQIINSHVLSASIDRYRMVQLHQPVTVILKHLQEENVTNPQCVYWEFNTRRWSSDGCWITQTNKSHTGCSCNHLTNFALVMDVSPAEVNVDDIPYIQIVTIIGCGVAIFFLLVTFVTLHLVRGLKDDRHVIHKNMCFCLIVSEVTFVGGIDYVMSRIICGVVAGLLHYFFLASFIWMFLETFQLLLMALERKDCSDSARRRWRWYCFSGYSVPIIAVSVCAIVDPESYGTKSYCWLEIDNYFIFGFVGPALACILMSIIFLCIVSAKIFRKIESSISCKSKEQSKLTNLRSCCQQCVCMLILLILTWGSAQWFLLWKTSLTVYLFTALNSLQGLLMFVLLCLRNPKVRKGLKKAHCCSQWLTECCRKPQNSQSNLYIHTNGLMILPQPSAISGHHIVGTHVLPTPSTVSSLSAAGPRVMEDNKKWTAGKTDRYFGCYYTRPPAYPHGRISIS
ncbi:latrophilin Cirl-like isoform X2 [Limulus polyphemus]|uniref:Latrophilin Cirl-like isoform X2 n=1 Tax=Limulus polyphemus TaxID=6850 RepID=A0ABM1SPE6_LIMPO|nr:latrophilin Cirl-like isoform X2 [Limulus polyphemus]